MGNCSVQSIIDTIIKNTKVISTEASLYKVVDEDKLRAYIAEKLQEKTAKSVLERITKISKIAATKTTEKATDAIFPIDPNIKYGAKDKGLPVNRLGAKGSNKFTFTPKNAKKKITISMDFVKNFGNPFKVETSSNKYTEPNTVGFFIQGGNKEASEEYYKWLTNEDYEYPTFDKKGKKLPTTNEEPHKNSIITNLNARKKFIQGYLKYIADGSIYSFKYNGTGVNDKYNHVQALVAAANKLHGVKKENPQTESSNDTDPNSSTPEFDKLPSWDPNVRTMAYAGIGSRETPPDILTKMTETAKWLNNKFGYKLQTGYKRISYGKITEEGADKAFSDGTVNKELFGPDMANDRTRKIAYEVHPNLKGMWNSVYNKWKGKVGKTKAEQYADGAINLQARNTNQVFGANLDAPVDFVLFYAEEQKSNPLRPKGGTGQAVEMARRKGIPTINMADEDWKKQLEEVLSKKPQDEDTTSSASEMLTWLTKKVGDKIAQFTTIPQAVSLIDILLYNKYGTPYNHGMHNTVKGKSAIQVIDKNGVLKLVENINPEAVNRYTASYKEYFVREKNKLSEQLTNYKKAISGTEDKEIKSRYENYITITTKQMEAIKEKLEKVAALRNDIKNNEEYFDMGTLKKDVKSTVQNIYSNEHMQGTVLHELGHSAFSRFLNENPEDPRVGRLQELFTQAKKAVEDGSIQGVDDYWKTDLHEFVSELFAQPKLVEKLNEIKAKGSTKVTLVEAVKKLIDSILSTVFKNMNKDSIAAEVFHILDNLETNKENTPMPANVEESINRFVQTYSKKGC